VLDHDFLDSFSLRRRWKAERYLQLLCDPHLDSVNGPYTRARVTPASRKIDDGWQVHRTDLDFLISSEAREALHREGIVIIDYSRIRQFWSRQWASGGQR
jgi:hypothetical protein